MYMDSLIQMALQSTWQLPEVSGNTAADSAEGSTGPSFQELLEQSRDNHAENTAGQTENGGTAEAPQDGEEPIRPDQKEEPSGDVALLDLSLLLRPQLVTQTEVTPDIQMTEGGVEAVQTVATAATAVPESEGNTPQTQLGAAVEAETPVTQTAQSSGDTAAETGSVQTLPADGTAVSQQTENGTSEEPSQDLTGSKTGRSQSGADTGDAVVEGMQTPLFREVESTPVRVGEAVVDMTAPPGEVEQSLSSALKGAVEQGAQHVEIRLNPADLGTVVAEFTSSPEGVLHVVLHAENEHTARLLSDHASALSLLLQDGGRAEVRVEVAQPQSEQNAWQQPDQDGGQRQQQQQQQRRNTPPQESESFLHQLRLGLVQQEER